ncbi:MAG: hypothetical protein ABI577_03060 [bacterium]
MGEKETARSAAQAGDSGAEPAEAIVKSKSNITNNLQDETEARHGAGSPGGPPLEASNLNLSKSN